MKRFAATLFAVAVSVTNLALAQQPAIRAARQAGPVGKQAVEIYPGKVVPIEEKRAWLLKQMLREFRGTGRTGEIEATVVQMSPERINTLVRAYKKRPQREQEERLHQANRRLAQSKAYRDYLVRQYQARLAAARGRGVGYYPVITTLPEGTNMWASAVVSPDRRYVRVSVQPFFSQIDRVDTFNFKTGRTRNVWTRPRNRPW